MKLSREQLGVLFGFAGVCLFGGTLPATRLAVASLDPIFLSMARAVLAGCAGALLLLIMRRPWPSRALLLEFLLAGTCTVWGYPLVIALAMTSVPASHGGVVLGIVPLATMALAAVVTHERPSAGFWAASTVGSLIVLAFVLWKNGTVWLEAGDLYLLGAVVFGAGTYVLSGRLSTKMPGWEVISWQVALYLPLTVVISVWLWPHDLAQVTPSAWAGLGYVSFVSMFLAFFVLNAAMALGGISRIGQLMLLQPFVIVALSIPLNGERFDAATVLFAAAVIVTVLVGQRMRVRRHPK
jgi:drug/metabolite transporter (DMT)-like permease